MEECKTDASILLELCMEAVQKNGLVLKCIPEHLRTLELCLAAVQANGRALEFVSEKMKTFELCFEAVKQDGLALKFVPESLKTSEICKIAIHKEPWALKYMFASFEDTKQYCNNANVNINSQEFSELSNVHDASFKEETKKEENSGYISISSSQLGDEYRKNKFAVAQKYKGKIIKITGDVVIIHTDGTILLNSGVKCNFINSELYKIAELKKGDSVTLFGFVNKFQDYIILEECFF